MPITTTFTASNYHNTVKDILREHLLDFFPPASYVVTFDPPATENIRKAIVYVSSIGSRNLDVLRTRRGGKTLQRKALDFAVVLISAPSVPSSLGPAHHVRQMASTFEHEAILKNGYKLADAGLRYARIQPFTDANIESEQYLFRKVSILSVTVYIEA